jgi:N6-L-threonylcarbamoyladenine synthase
MDKMYLGIDTSNYTSSIAVVDSHGNIVYREEILLDVRNNNCGLRQSDAYYKHTFNLPMMIESMSDRIELSEIASIGISVKPRPYISSYMPVFMAAYNTASVISSLQGNDLRYYTHQDGHFFASIMDSNIESFRGCNNLCIHLSGGTTEFIKYRIDDNKISSEILLSSLDISFGQLIDRIGVASKLSFPCGKEMDRISSECREDVKTFFRPTIRNKGINISGLENKFKKMIEDGNDVSFVYKSIFHNISEALVYLIHELLENYEFENIVFVGGVSSNSVIMEKVGSQDFGKSKIIFGKKENLRDNAAGIAYMNYLGVEYCDTRWQKDFKENYRRSKE